MTRILALLFVSLFAVQASAQANPWVDKLPFEEAVIHYELSGMQKGTQTTYVRDFGRQTAVHKRCKVGLLGLTAQQEDIVISNDEWQVTVNLLDSTGVKHANPKRFLIEEFEMLSSVDQVMIAETVERLAGPDSDEELSVVEFLGYTCEKMESKGMTVLSLEGSEFYLSFVGKFFIFKLSQVATTVEEGPVGDVQFEIPDYIHVEENEEENAVLKAEAKTMMRCLLEGRYPSTEELEADRPPVELTEEQKEKLPFLLRKFVD